LPFHISFIANSARKRPELNRDKTIDDGIQYHSDNKSGEYDLIDGQTETEFGIKPTPRGKKTTPLENYSTVTD